MSSPVICHTRVAGLTIRDHLTPQPLCRAILLLCCALLGLALSAPPAHAATLTVGSPSYEDVSAAVAGAADGDTILVPAGTATWMSTLRTTKAVSIIGAGEGKTVISNGVGLLFEFRGQQEKPFRLSGFQFNNEDNQRLIVSLVGPISKARVDHCTFNKGDCAVGSNWHSSRAAGPCYGVVDHCRFRNMKRAYFSMDCRNNDGGEVAWTEPMQPGTDKTMVFEDNEFVWDNELTDRNAQGALYGQYGGKCCFRYNTCTGFCFYVDAHGDKPNQGTMLYEIYGNTFIEGNAGGATQGYLCWQRGGTWIVHDNVFRGKVRPIRMSVYHTTDVHTIRDTYFWGNTWNGSSDQAAMLFVGDSGQTPAGYSAGRVLIDQQYFLHAPRPGQTFHPYTPLVYPHPLVADPASGTAGQPAGAAGPTGHSVRSR